MASWYHYRTEYGDLGKVASCNEGECGLFAKEWWTHYRFWNALKLDQDAEKAATYRTRLRQLAAAEPNSPRVRACDEFVDSHPSDEPLDLFKSLRSHPPGNPR
jgi:hypothetical protein